MSAIIDDAFARQFAADWVAAWNSGDLERIFTYYADEGEGISSARPPLRFELIAPYAGVSTIAIHYRSVGRRCVVEVLDFDDDHRAIRGNACHGAPDDTATP
jgi:hypothetical protein